MARRKEEDLPGYQYNNVSTEVESYLVPRHPVYQCWVPKEEEGTYPNIEFNIFIRHCLNVESDCWDGGHRLIEFEFIQYRWWSGSYIWEDLGEGRGSCGWTN